MKGTQSREIYCPFSQQPAEERNGIGVLYVLVLI